MATRRGQKDGDDSGTFSYASSQAGCDRQMPHSMEAALRTSAQHASPEFWQINFAQLGQQMNRGVAEHNAGNVILKGEPVAHLGFVKRRPAVLVGRRIN